MKTRGRIHTGSRCLMVGALSVGMVIGAIGSSHAYERPGKTTLASFDGQVAMGTTASHRKSISGNGRYVAFVSSPTDPVTGSVPVNPMIYRHDLLTRETVLGSVSSEGTPGVGACYYDGLEAGTGSSDPSMNASGRYLAFTSCANNLAPGDTNLKPDVYLHDFKTGSTKRVSVAPDGGEASDGTTAPSISGSGRFIAMHSKADNLVAGDDNDRIDVFLVDVQENETRLVSVSGAGQQGDNDSSGAVIDATGKFIVFSSFATNLVPGDSNAKGDLFVFDAAKEHLERLPLVVDTGASTPVDMDPLALGWESISAGGRYVTFYSTSAALVPVKSNGNRSYDVYVHDRKTGRNERVSVTSVGEEGRPGGKMAVIVGGSVAPVISDDGRFVAFESSAVNFTSGDGEQVIGAGQELEEGLGDNDIFVHDLMTGTTNLVSVDLDGQDPHCGTAPWGTSVVASIDSNGRHIAFESCGENMTRDPRPVTLPGESLRQTYVWDQGPTLGLGQFLAPRSGTRLSVPDISAIAERGFAWIEDASGDAAQLGNASDLWGVQVAHRPESNDVYFSLKLQGMSAAEALDPTLIYGLDLVANGTKYEIRAGRSSITGTGEPTFGLFDCSVAPCAHVANLTGGYGTTGAAITFAIPLDSVGLETGGALTDMRAFTAVGTVALGPVLTLDELTLSE